MERALATWADDGGVEEASIPSDYDVLGEVDRILRA